MEHTTIVILSRRYLSNCPSFAGGTAEATGSPAGTASDDATRRWVRAGRRDKREVGWRCVIGEFRRWLGAGWIGSWFGDGSAQ